MSWDIEPLPSSENTYRETFPTLDLEFEVPVTTSDQRLRNICFLALKDALAELRGKSKIDGASR